MNPRVTLTEFFEDPDRLNDEEIQVFFPEDQDNIQVKEPYRVGTRDPYASPQEKKE